MSSNIWTPAALSSESAASEGHVWRLVEAQHHVSTTKLTDTLADQQRLELLIEEAKPGIPQECRHLHYLLFTPFRYGAPYPRGSRFRRAGLTPGVFYGSEQAKTAAIETAFWRLLFFSESPATPRPTTVAQFTAFSAEFITGMAIDLTLSPFKSQQESWIDPTDYAACQKLAEAARTISIDVIKYQSCRDPDGGKNIAILSCRAFKTTTPANPQTWRIHLSSNGVRLFREFPRLALNLSRTDFAADPRIAAMNWER